jgi:NTE family protein
MISSPIRDTPLPQRPKSQHKELRIGTALALSGGGFRATLFHLGALWRLNEIGYLKRLNRITSVSGGSIVNGVLATQWRHLQFDASGIAQNFKEIVAQPIRRFCDKRIDATVSILGFLTWPTAVLAPLGYNILPGNILAWVYDRILFKGARLKDLPADSEGPRFIFYATSYQTGVGVRFSRPYVGDWRLGLLRSGDSKVATAVAASSAFPPVFAPMRLRTRIEDWDPEAKAPLAEAQGLRQCMYLADGGIYDNLGEEAASRYETVLVSDAGAPFGVVRRGWLFHISHVYRISRVREIAMEQARALRIRHLVRDYQEGRHKGAYWGIASKIKNYGLELSGLGAALVQDNPTTGAMQSVSTRLWPLPPRVQGNLINWGYALCDAALRRYVLTEPVDSGSWPVPECAL